MDYEVAEIKLVEMCDDNVYQTFVCLSNFYSEMYTVYL